LFFHETINLDTGKSLKDYVKIHSKYSAGIFLKKYLANKIWFIQNKLAYTPLFHILDGYLQPSSRQMRRHITSTPHLYPIFFALGTCPYRPDSETIPRNV